MLVLVCGLGAGSALADAESDFEMLFGAEAKKVAATPSKADDAAFASKLLAAGKSLGDAPALQALVYEKAYAFGIKHRASYARALEALELWGKVAPDQVGGLQAKRLDLLRLQYEASHARPGRLLPNGISICSCPWLTPGPPAATRSRPMRCTSRPSRSLSPAGP